MIKEVIALENNSGPIMGLTVSIELTEKAPNLTSKRLLNLSSTGSSETALVRRISSMTSF